MIAQYAKDSTAWRVNGEVKLVKDKDGIVGEVLIIDGTHLAQLVGEILQLCLKSSTYETVRGRSSRGSRDEVSEYSTTGKSRRIDQEIAWHNDK